MARRRCWHWVAYAVILLLQPLVSSGDSSSDSSSSTPGVLEHQEAFGAAERDLAAKTRVKDVIDHIIQEQERAAEHDDGWRSAMWLEAGCERVVTVTRVEPKRRDLRRDKKKVFAVLRKKLELYAPESLGVSESCLHALVNLAGAHYEEQVNSPPYYYPQQLQPRENSRMFLLALGAGCAQDVHKDNIRAMLDAGLLPTVMNLVASQPTELSIQEHGLSLLARLTLRDHDGARARIAADGGGCEKQYLLSNLYIETIIVPRQARDKHRKG
jgi:hypothetical protein